jgi:hypothetical protein
MTERHRDSDDDPNDEPKLMTRIDGEEARLLVHIEPIEDTEPGARTDEAPPPLAE